MKACLILLFVISFLCRCTVFSSCVTCGYNTPKEECRDPYEPMGSEEEACEDIDEQLCMLYGDYAIYCTSRGASYSCKKQGQCGDIVPVSCVTCSYGTPKKRCRDPFTPQGSIGDICDKDETDEALCEKYGDYAIYCGGSGSTISCFKQGQCQPTGKVQYEGYG